ncbi:M20 metallopeptidase family protein [Clostridiisalibacter paucivorans]|uniref:M20 metallopeptidase family protein n=1 Tax=Clostridiisalibacter paucivorans TaxID=408753 RepID=UPI00047CE71F|nr:M20 family metallopeptidase [Clostridiisalibacter paucivorans]
MEKERIVELSKKYYDRYVELRHEIHMYPETAFEEERTAKLVANELEKLGIEVYRNIGKTGVLGIIRGKYPGHTVLLRADMDALDIQEEADVPYRSKVKGKMHACGHDGHTAGLLGAAMILNELKDEIHGNIKLVFQPAEEDSGGAKPMIDEGILENPKVDVAFGCHLWGDIKEGNIMVKYGPMMAAPDKFIIKVIGKGGHASMPHKTIDPITISAQVINSMQTIVSRKVSPLKSAVISFGSINGGLAHNVIPNVIEMSGTVRTFDDDLRKWIPEAMEKTLKGIVELNDASYEFDYIEHFPPLINNDEMTDLVSQSVSKVVGEENIIIGNEPNMGGEDFAYFAQAVPSCFFFVGIAPDEDNPIPHHHPHFAWDDKNLLVSSQSLAMIALDYLEKNI